MTRSAVRMLPRAAEEALTPRPVRLVTLEPGPEVCQRRNATRDADERFYFDGYDELHDDMRRHFDGIGWWFDTSALAPEGAAAHLVREAIHRAVLNGAEASPPEPSTQRFDRPQSV